MRDMETKKKRILLPLKAALWRPPSGRTGPGEARDAEVLFYLNSNLDNIITFQYRRHYKIADALC